MKRTSFALIAAGILAIAPVAANATLYQEDFSDAVANGATLHGTAVVTGNHLQLTDQVNGQQGSMVLDALDAGAIRAFSASFLMAIGPGTLPPADGISFNYGTLPDASFGEEGPGGGHILTIAFDTFDNGGGEAPAIDINVNGATVAHTLLDAFTGGQFVPVSVSLDNGLVTVIFNGVPVYTNVASGFVTAPGDRFGFGGRTGGLNEVNSIDDISITTRLDAAIPEPASLSLLGLAIAGLLPRRRGNA